MTEELTDDEIEGINKALEVLQRDMVDVIENIKKENYEEAIEKLNHAMTHTECPVCKDKFVIVGADIVKTKTLCKLGEKNCLSQKSEAIGFAERVRDTFLPIATEKSFINKRETDAGRNAIYTKENNYRKSTTETINNDADDVEITPFNAPFVIMKDFLNEMSK